MLDKRIGILFNSKLLHSLIRGSSMHESITNYEEAAMCLQVQPVYFCLEDVDVSSMQVRAYMRLGRRYVRRLLPLPHVIHNRAIYFRSRAQAKLRTLTKRNICIYNQVNRYGKLTIHQLLLQDPCIAPHLPETKLATAAHISSMMQRHQSLIFKPDNSSIGRGVMKSERTDAGWRTQYAITNKQGRRQWRTAFTRSSQLPAALLRQLRKERYLIQETIPLATFHDRPYDLRVSVQRNLSGNWQITGIVGKVAPKHTFVTNVAQGGCVVPFDELAAWSLPHIRLTELYSRISQLSFAIASRLASELPHMADLGLDIGLTQDGNPLFIECNGRDQRYSFLEANQQDIWKATYENPIAYGVYLMNNQTICHITN